MAGCDGSLSWGQCMAFAAEFDTARADANAQSTIYTAMRATDFRKRMAPCCRGSRAPCCLRASHRECPIGSAPRAGGPDDVCHRQSGAPPSAATVVAQTWALGPTPPPSPASADWDPRPWAGLVVPVLLFLIIIIQFRAHRREVREAESRHAHVLRTLEDVERF
jgi:hypothetical protein